MREAFHPAGNDADYGLATLTGSWRITRRIGDLRAGLTGRLIGTALFTPTADGLDYAEEGVLRFGGFNGPAAQRYRYVFETPSRAEILFEDGRAFHTVDFTSGRADVRHDCLPDDYRGRYCIHDLDHWSLSWTIHGPRKHLRMTTRYNRL